MVAPALSPLTAYQSSPVCHQPSANQVFSQANPCPIWNPSPGSRSGQPIGATVQSGVAVCAEIAPARSVAAAPNARPSAPRLVSRVCIMVNPSWVILPNSVPTYAHLYGESGQPGRKGMQRSMPELRVQGVAQAVAKQ